MATRTVANGGGNYNATTTWVEGIVPTLSDDVVFTATSGNLTINAASLNCLSINFTNYVGTITFTQPLNVYGGGINLGTGGYTQAGGSGIIVRAAATLTSNGVVFSRGLAFSTGATVTLADNWTVTGVLQLGGTTNQVINGNNFYVTSLNTNNTGACSGTTNFIFNSTGTWDNSSTGQLRNNVTINTTGTITISGNIYYNTGTLTYTAGTVTTTGSTLNSAASTTLNTSGMTWNNITFGGTSQTYTLTSNLNLSGNLTFSGTTLISIAGAFSVNVGGNLTVTTNATST